MAAQYFTEQKIEDRYVLLQELGFGGMAVVWKALDTKENKPVAIKFLDIKDETRREPGEVERLKHRFAEEYAKHAQFSHPNIVRLFGSGTDASGTPFIVMEFLDGKTLDQELAEYRTAVRSSKYPYHPQLYVIMKQLLEAVGFLHQRHIIHRDLKPQNVFIVPKGAEGVSVYLLDFGIALSLQSDLSRLTQVGMIIGTPLYMPPEQIAGFYEDHSGKPWQAGRQSDIFAIATILYEAVTGQPSVVVGTKTPNAPLAHLRDHTDLSMPSPDPALVVKDLNPILREVIMHGMAKRPEERIQTVDHFLELLEKAEQLDIKRKATSVPPPASTPPPPSARSQRMFPPDADTQQQAPVSMHRRDPPPPPRRALSPPASPEAPKVDPMPPSSRLPETIPKKSLAPIVVMAGALLLGILITVIGTKRQRSEAPVGAAIHVAKPPTLLVPPPIPSVRPSATVPITVKMPAPVPSVEDEADQLFASGLLLQKQGNCREAAELFTQAMAKRPDDPVLVKAAIVCQRRLGHSRVVIFLTNKFNEIRKNRP